MMGALAHYALQVREWLEKFSRNHIIALNHEVGCTPRPPDLKPCYFFLWGYIKSQVAVAQWLRASNIFRQICKSTSEWRGFESRWFYQSGFEFAKTALSILNH